MPPVLFVTQESVWIACEGADKSTSGGWTQKTTRTWAWRSPLPPKSPVSTAPSLIHCLPLPPPLLCLANMQVKLVKLSVACSDGWRFIVQKCIRCTGIFFFFTSWELKDDKTLWGGQRQGAGGHLYTFCSTCMHSVGIRAFSAFVLLIQIEASSISLHNDEENLRDRHFAVCCNFAPCLSACPVFLPSRAFAMIWPSDLAFYFDTPRHSSSSHQSQR